MGDHPAEGCYPWKTKCAQNQKQEYQRLHGKNGCVLVPDWGLRLFAVKKL